MSNELGGVARFGAPREIRTPDPLVPNQSIADKERPLSTPLLTFASIMDVRL